MSGSLLAIILIPVITVALIAIWLVMVLRAASRRPPSHGPGKEPAQPVVGGVLRGDARQMTVHRDAPPRRTRKHPGVSKTTSDRGAGSRGKAAAVTSGQ